MSPDRLRITGKFEVREQVPLAFQPLTSFVVAVFQISRLSELWAKACEAGSVSTSLTLTGWTLLTQIIRYLGKIHRENMRALIEYESPFILEGLYLRAGMITITLPESSNMKLRTTHPTEYVIGFGYVGS